MCTPTYNPGYTQFKQNCERSLYKQSRAIYLPGISMSQEVDLRRFRSFVYVFSDRSRKWFPIARGRTKFARMFFTCTFFEYDQFRWKNSRSD